MKKTINIMTSIVIIIALTMGFATTAFASANDERIRVRVWLQVPGCVHFNDGMWVILGTTEANIAAGNYILCPLFNGDVNDPCCSDPVDIVAAAAEPALTPEEQRRQDFHEVMRLDTASEWAHDAIVNANFNGWFNWGFHFTDLDGNDTLLWMNPWEYRNNITRAEFAIIILQWIQSETNVRLDEWSTRNPAFDFELTFMGSTAIATQFEVQGIAQRLTMRYVNNTVMEHRWVPGREGVEYYSAERITPLNLQDLHDNHQEIFMKSWVRAESVVVARRLGITSTDNLNDYITREQAATIIMRAVNVVNLINAGEVPLYEIWRYSQAAINTPNANFTDRAQVSSEYVAGVTFVRANEIMGDVGSYRFNPQGFFTVESAIVSINNVDVGKANINSASPWARAYITNAIAAGLVPQSLQSNYMQAITRAEFCALAVMLYESVMGEIAGRVTFTDTDDVNVQKMAYVGIVSGVGNNRFAPNDTLTREQAAIMLSRLSDAIGEPFPTQAPTFADNNRASSWALGSIGRVQAAGIMNATGNNNFSPRQQFTREQSIIAFLRIFETEREVQG